MVAPRRNSRPHPAPAEHAASTRELAVLVDGPWAHRWYWRDQLEAMQRASRTVGYPDEHPSAVLRGYRPTGTRRPHPDGCDRTGREWRYQPPTRQADTATTPPAEHQHGMPQIPTQRRPSDPRGAVPAVEPATALPMGALW